MSDDLKKQVDIMAQAFIDTFSHIFWSGSRVQYAAFVLEEMRGGRTMADRKHEAEEKAAELAKIRREGLEAAEAQEREYQIADATEFLTSLGYTVEKKK